ncbi:MAG: glycosyltransferase [Clostridium sp.]|nr:glycosyltransferase [Lachnoclostridium sp.]MCM1253426.1 glycosyltransferase [Clostridium sp.]
MVLQSSLKVQVLISAVEQNVKELPEKMNIETDAVLVNQCDSYGYREQDLRSGLKTAKKPYKIQCMLMKERGVGLSRNTALMHADADIVLFSDEDIVLEKGYAGLIQEAYEQYLDADMIIFNVKVAPERKTYWNEEVKRIRWYNYGRYPAYSISGKLDSFRRANVHFSLLFGGGAKYSNGEDSLFLRDCLRAGLKIIALPVCIGEETLRESTWFHGYTRKFFTDRGVLYYYLYGKLSGVFAFRFLLKNKKEMCQKIPFKKAYRLMKEGIRSQRQH